MQPVVPEGRTHRISPLIEAAHDGSLSYGRWLSSLPQQRVFVERMSGRMRLSRRC